MAKYIDSLKLPEDLCKLNEEQIKTICQELRNELIDIVSRQGGHFASSLGVTELTTCLHKVFKSPLDKLVWDVGHQAYIHKMLTGRRSELENIRKKNGISGFLKRSESQHDSFGAGHAGTSISAAVGMAVAEKKLNTKNQVVAVIGDGSLTAGMAFEALNHAGSLALDNLVVILNDNAMSISPNVGALSWLFSRFTTNLGSTKLRAHFKNLHKKGVIPDLFYRAIDRAEEATQGFISTPAQLFGAFGFRYIGPIDGHNIKDLCTALENAKEQDIPTLVHVLTVKGKGFAEAEEDPVKWHGISPKSGKSKAPISFTEAFSNSLLDLAKADSKIIGITAAMPSGTGLDLLQKELPEQFFDVGICEQHAITFAAGLATQGYKPVCAIYSTFLQRGYDQLVHDVCIQNLPVIFAIDRAGVVGNDGETHQGVFDISFLRSIPNLVIMAPSNQFELAGMLSASLKWNCPVAIRYPRGSCPEIESELESPLIEIGKSNLIKRGKKIALFGLGNMQQAAACVAKELEELFAISVSLIDPRFIKPIDEKLIMNLSKDHDIFITIEDHALQAGFGSALLEFISDYNLAISLKRFGVQDNFVSHASQSEQQYNNAYSKEQILAEVVELLSKTRENLAAN